MARRLGLSKLHNDFDMDMYLRISVGELWQKRLMAAGFPKTFEIGRVYRNEGTSPEHLQEFTNMEFYWGYADYKMGMELVKDLYRTIAKKVLAKPNLNITATLLIWPTTGRRLIILGK